MNFRKMLLTTIIGIGGLFIIILTYGANRVLTYQLIEQQERNLGNIVEKTLSEVDLWIKARERDAVLFSKNGVFIDMWSQKRLAEAEKRLKIYHDLSDFYENVFIADTDGKCLISSETGEGSKQLDLSKSDGMISNLKMARKGKTWVGDPMVCPVTGKYIFLITAPIIENGKVKGIFGTSIDLSVFSELLLDSVKIGKSGYIFMTDSKGKCIYHPDQNLIFNINLADKEFGSKMIANRNGIISYEWEGRKKITSYRTYEKKGWIICTTNFKDEILDITRKISKFSVLFGFMAIGLLVLTSFGMTGVAFKIANKSIKELESISIRLHEASIEVSSTSNQLAEGASQQAASLEESSSSLEQMSSMTKTNAENAKEADKIVKQSLSDMEEASGSMFALTSSMNEIYSSGEETQKIVKTIDEISFQTNLLALNAAVEAARAGEAGAGFAVVSDEVRNLAMRAADAAGNTAELIDQTVTKVDEGVKLVESTNDAFSLVVSGAMTTGALIGKIANASIQQADGIYQINRAVGEMDKITQQNAANAQQSASASEEMKSQAKQMRTVLNRLSSLIGGNSISNEQSSFSNDFFPQTPEKYKQNNLAHHAKPVHHAREIRPEEIIPLDDDDFKDF